MDLWVTRDIDIFSPQAWDSRRMRESWRAYSDMTA